MTRIAGRVGLIAATMLVLGLVAYVYGRFGFNNMADIADSRMTTHPDFNAFHFSASAWWSGDDPYPQLGMEQRNSSPPVWMPLFAYFTRFDVLVAYHLWVIVSIVAMLVALTWTAETVRASTPIAVIGVTALMLSGPMQGTLLQGQTYVLLALGLVAAWVLERQGRTSSSALLLGVLAGLKLSLLPLILWPATQRRWRDVGLAVAGFLGSFVVGLLFGGPSATIGWARRLSDVNPDADHFDNIALIGEIYRLFTPTRSSGHLADVPWAGVAAKVIVLVLVAATLWLVRDRTPGYRMLGFWALVAACLLASPITWRGYVVFLAPAALILFADRRRRPLGALLIALVLIPNSWALVFDDRSTALASVGLALPSLALLVHWVVLVSLRAEPGSSASALPFADGAEESGRQDDAEERAPAEDIERVGAGGLAR